MSDSNGTLEIGKIRHPKKCAFLAALAETGTVLGAHRASGVDRQSHYNWLEEDPEYALAATEAMEQACQSMEQEAIRRARDGTDEPVFHKGEVCGKIRKYSDNLLMFLLKGQRPNKYRESPPVNLQVNNTNQTIKVRFVNMLPEHARKKAKVIDEVQGNSGHASQ